MRRIIKTEDCTLTSPPSTSFVFYPRDADDLEFIAELTDLPTANRLTREIVPELDEDAFSQIKYAACTIRIGVSSLKEQFQLPKADPDYCHRVLNHLTAVTGATEADLLEKAFFIRTFHY
jgi:hypothetical protein